MSCSSMFRFIFALISFNWFIVSNEKNISHWQLEDIFHLFHTFHINSIIMTREVGAYHRSPCLEDDLCSFIYGGWWLEVVVVLSLLHTMKYIALRWIMICDDLRVLTVSVLPAGRPPPAYSAVQEHAARQLWGLTTVSYCWSSPRHL